MNQEVFQRYFQHRCQAAGAVTAGQQLEVLYALREEARRGLVPVDEGTVVRLDLEDAAVQAVLRGEKVELPAGQQVRAGRRGALADLPLAGKVGVLLGVMLLPVLLALLGLRQGMSPRPGAATATWTPVPVIATSSGMATGSGVGVVVEGERGGEAGLNLLFSPTATSTVTSPAMAVETVVYLPRGNDAASDPTAPASIALGGVHLIVHEGRVDPKSGLWQPQGVEWLAGTVVRKVIAVPREILEEMPLVVGEAVYLRYRNGFTATYTLVQVLKDVVADQIELMASSKPSLVIIGYTNDLRNPRRLVVLAEIMYPAPTPILAAPQPTATLSPTETPSPSETPSPPPYTTIGMCNLRISPTTRAAVVTVLPQGAAVWLVPGVAPIVSEGTTWVYVHTEFGEGWLVFALLVPNP